MVATNDEATLFKGPQWLRCSYHFGRFTFTIMAWLTVEELYMPQMTVGMFRLSQLQARPSFFFHGLSLDIKQDHVTTEARTENTS